MIHTTQTHQIGDAIDLMQDLPAASVDLGIVDPPHSSEVLEAYKRAKKAGEANDMRSRRIVRKLYREREGDVAGAPSMRGQMALFDFKKVV